MFSTILYINYTILLLNCILISLNYHYNLSGSIPRKTVFAMPYICKTETTHHVGVVSFNINDYQSYYYYITYCLYFNIYHLCVGYSYYLN